MMVYGAMKYGLSVVAIRIRARGLTEEFLSREKQQVVQAAGKSGSANAQHRRKRNAPVMDLLLMDLMVFLGARPTS
jgi:hypothetical protein